MVSPGAGGLRAMGAAGTLSCATTADEMTNSTEAIPVPIPPSLAAGAEARQYKATCKLSAADPRRRSPRSSGRDQRDDVGGCSPAELTCLHMGTIRPPISRRATSAASVPRRSKIATPPRSPVTSLSRLNPSYRSAWNGSRAFNCDPQLVVHWSVRIWEIPSRDRIRNVTVVQWHID